MDMTWKSSLGIVFSRDARNTTLRGSVSAPKRISHSSSQLISYDYMNDGSLSQSLIREAQQANKTDACSTVCHQQFNYSNPNQSSILNRGSNDTQFFDETEGVNLAHFQGESPRLDGSNGCKLASSSVRIGNPRSNSTASAPAETKFYIQYRIPEETLRLTKTLPAVWCKRWDFSLYRSPNGKPPIAHYCTQPESFERVIRLLEGQQLLGFDLEWRPNATSSDPWWHNVAVLQLASQQHIGVFHFAHAAQTFLDRKAFDDTKIGESTNNVSQSDIIPANMRTLLESTTVIKAGVNIGNDRTRLEKYCGVRMRASVELSHLFKVIKYSNSKEYHLINKRVVAMSEQANDHLPLPLHKGSISYSASDAYAGLMLYLEMEAKRQAMDPVPLSPLFDELKQPIPLIEDIESAARSVTYTSTNSGTETTVSPSGGADKDESLANEERAVSELNKRLFEESQLFARQWQGTNGSGTSISLTPAVLRSYYLWHHRLFPPQRICAILRSPPLRIRTVTKYIWTAVQTGKLEHDTSRFADEVMARSHFISPSKAV